MSALRVKPQMDPLERERQEIERRRQRCNERAKRLLHAKTRLIGVDTLALSQQVSEKQERERLDLERNLYYDDLNVTHGKMITDQQTIRERERRRKAEELNFFRKEQEKEKRRRDLLDESALRNFQDMDTAFLKFQGEDLDKANRVKAQQMQQQDWLAQQINQLAASELQNRQDEEDYDATQERIRQIQEEQEATARDRKACERARLNEFNRQQGAYKKAERARAAQVTQQLDDMELSSQINSKFLNEGVSARAGTASFKGFSTAQRQRIIDEQQLQQEELRARSLRDQKEERDYAQQQEEIRRAMVKADREREARRQQATLNLAKEREMQAKEKTLRYDYLDNVVYTNPVQESFFDQFGRGCR
jgi:hypothetical protein